MDSGNKNWAAEYLLDPLNAPDPSMETGPGSSFRPDTVPALLKNPPSPQSNRLSKTNPYSKASISSKDGSKGSPTTTTTTTTELPRRSNTTNSRLSSSSYGYPSPPTSKADSPRSPNFPNSPSHRHEAFSDPPTGRNGRRRGSSLTERFPGDLSHRPLDTLSREKATADKSRHVTKRHRIHPDSIDSLDNVGGSSYHHAGPYDATLASQNVGKNTPLDALKDSNAETLKATPREKIIDSVKGHRPLDGVAAYPPGTADRTTGHVYEYEQGENMMIDNNPEGGAYKRYPGIQYHPDDLKGKGEPSYSIEKALKEHKISDGEKRRSAQDPDGIEMTTQSGHSRVASAHINDDGESVRRSGSFSKRLSGGSLKKRIGSIKKKLKHDE